MEDRKTLVVVESPTKAKTINRYLGGEYKVTSSMGHLIDLPKSRLAVDVDNGFEPDYITIRGRGKLLKQLKREAGRSKRVYLAADSYREGEAISFHIKNAIQKDRPQLEVRRIVFNEITEDAIKDAVLHPRDIDLSLVNAQKARRVLDRLVGYNLSPLLWEKIKKGLSAGRVQSVALKVICEREEEIAPELLRQAQGQVGGHGVKRTTRHVHHVVVRELHAVVLDFEGVRELQAERQVLGLGDALQVVKHGNGVDVLQIVAECLVGYHNIGVAEFIEP